MENKKFFLYLFGGVFAVLFLIGLMGSMLAGGFRGGSERDGDRIAVIEVKGSITGGTSGGSIFGEVVAGAETMMRQLRRAADDPTIKGLILHINSPGGSAPASEAVYNEVLRFKEKTGKPVLAIMGDVAASGGYFIAVGADEIFANPATMTGSIGVIMQFRNLSELYDKYGIRVETIKSGKYKDIGNPGREMTNEERALLQEMVDQIYEQFVKAVMNGRDLAREVVLEVAQGQIYTGIQAKELDLIDHLGNFYDGVEYLAEKVGIKGDPILVYYTGRQTFLERLFGGLAQAVVAGLGRSQIPTGSTEIMLIEESLRNNGINNLQLSY